MIKSDLKSLINFFKYLKPYWKKQIMVLLLSFATASLALVGPYLTKLVIDKAYAQRDLNIFVKLLILGALVFVVSSLLNSLLQYLKDYIEIKVGFDLEKATFKKLESLPYGFFQKRPTGEYIYKLMSDSSRVASFITNIIPELFYTIPKFLFIFVILLIMHWKMTLFIVIAIPFLYIPSFLVIRRIRKKSEELLESSQDMFEVVREIFANMQVVKVFGKEKAGIRRFTRRLINNTKINIASIKLNILSSFLDNWVNRLILGLITIYGGYNIIKGQMTLGSFTAIMLYLNQLLGLQGYFSGLFVRMTVGSISTQRLSNILDSWPEEKDDESAKEFMFPSGEIEFKDVSFAYYPGKDVIQHLNFKIEGASAVGLVGHSGCGKTTLNNLIIKLYKISNGRILIDGQDVNLIKNKSLREQIGVAMQKPILWNDTIRNNIIYPRPKATNEEVLRAAEISCAYDFIKNLPQGFDTAVGEGAARLSEGQRQRISLARVIIKNPKILIIDEGMSSLDSQTEDNIIDNLKREFKSTTIIVVSHRLSTIKKMELVYFLEGPGKISIGPHDQLVKDNISYKELFASQIEEEKIDIKL